MTLRSRLSAVARAVKTAVGPNDLSMFDSRRAGTGGGWKRILEPWSGAWQHNVEWTTDSVLSAFAIWACITRIAQDVSKLRYRLVSLTADGIWIETANPAYSPVLRKPNDFQNHVQFKETWLISKLVSGNAYILKERDDRGVVVKLTCLAPERVKPLITKFGDVYYRLASDDLAGVEDGGTVVPASEIIHDRMNCLFHPLCGISPIFAAGLAADQSLKIQVGSSKFFGNGSKPGALLIAPGEISPENAAEVKAYWDKNFTGDNAGKVAVLSDGMTYTPLRENAVDSQLAEQLKLSAEIVCSCFHVPPYKVGIGAMPTQTNIEALGIQYYEECLQVHVEHMEACMDEGLGLNVLALGVELDVENLQRMDTTAKTAAVTALVKGGISSPNEGRKRFNMPPVEGGEKPMMQQQMFSLPALAERDAAKPFAKPTTAPAAPPAPTPGAVPGDDPADDGADEVRQLFEQLTKDFECAPLI